MRFKDEDSTTELFVFDCIREIRIGKAIVDPRGGGGMSMIFKKEDVHFL